MGPESFVELLYEERAAAIIRTDDQETAASAMVAAARGGFRILEFTLGCPGAYDLIRDFSRREGLVIGVGTVLTPAQAEIAVEAGARFVGSPVTDERVIDAARSLGVAAMPGAFTATELERAHRAGAQLQKLFPAPASGPDYVRAVLGPLPQLRIVPTSGVTAANAADWLAAGAHAVGFVSSLFDPALLRAHRFDDIEQQARACIAAVRAAQRPDSR
jgi:2-dehydro-3-deoxyphosphogluconate aldolase/(4S)-4-hydroxy-2-oxoglutarate aldolase